MLFFLLLVLVASACTAPQDSSRVSDRCIPAASERDFDPGGWKTNFCKHIMWDRQTESWWQQFTGEGIVGDLTRMRLTSHPASIIAWRTFRVKSITAGGTIR